MKFLFILAILMASAFTSISSAEEAIVADYQQVNNTQESESMLQQCVHDRAVSEMKVNASHRIGENLVTYAYNQAWDNCIDKDHFGDGLKPKDLIRIVDKAVEQARRELMGST